MKIIQPDGRTWPKNRYVFGAPLMMYLWYWGWPEPRAFYFQAIV